MFWNLYELGSVIIAALQKRLKPWETALFMVSSVSDPASAFTIIFPLIVPFEPYLSTEILVVSIVAEWANTLLKWLFMEHRPYWWVKENSRIELYQTPMTCETGPGSPSGHVMGATAVLYVLLCWTIQRLILPKSFMSVSTKTKLIVAAWIVFTVTVMLVALSRLYIAAHFPHQCILGFTCGIAVAWLIRSPASKLSRWKKASRRKLIVLSAMLGIISLSAYWLQKALGIDPQWSVHLAFKWCHQPDFIHVTTTPLFSLVRDAAAAFGLALSAPFSKLKKCQKQSIGLVLSTLVALVVNKGSESVPTGNVGVFYALQFLLFAVQPILLLKILPKVTSSP